MVRRVLALLLFFATVVARGALAQTAQQSQWVTQPALSVAPFTLSTVCATPATPASCASTSYAIIPLSVGASLMSLQIVGSMSGDTITTLSGNDGANFLALTTMQPNNAAANSSSTITAAGRYAANVADAAYVEVALTAGSTPVTVTPYISQKSTTSAPQTSAAPGYARVEDGTTTNLVCVLSDGALCIGTSSTLVQVNPTVTASSAYSAGNCVGGLLSFTPAFRGPNTGILESIAISVKSTQSVSFKLYVFNANPSSSTFTDKAAPAINAADIGKAVGVYTLASYDNGLGTSTVYNLDGIGKQISSSSTTLYAVLVTTAAVTFSSSSDVFVSVGVLQD